MGFLPPVFGEDGMEIPKLSPRVPVMGVFSKHHSFLKTYCCGLQERMTGECGVADVKIPRLWGKFFRKSTLVVDDTTSSHVEKAAGGAASTPVCEPASDSSSSPSSSTSSIVVRSPPPHSPSSFPAGAASRSPTSSKLAWVWGLRNLEKVALLKRLRWTQR